MAAYCLALHENYGCRHSGLCCSADWLIPAEEDVVRTVKWLGIRGADRGFVEGTPGEEPWLARHPDGSCVFFDEERRLCRIHLEAGPAALPSACRHFPREILQDARGTFISLSHYCPSAAGLLARRGELAVVQARPPLAIDGELESLDARDALPPLLRPGLLSDLDGYDAWERACLATFAREDLASDEALRVIAGATEAVRCWTPGSTSLASAVEGAFRSADPRDPVLGDPYAPLLAQRPPDQSGPVEDLAATWDRLVEPAIAPRDYMIKNYLAARLFGNWIAYQGRGLRSIVAWLATCDAVLRNEIARRAGTSGAHVTADDVTAAAGAADLLLVHTIDSASLAKDFGAVEA